MMISAFLAVAQVAASSSNYYEFIEKSDLVNFVDAVRQKEIENYLRFCGRRSMFGRQKCLSVIVCPLGGSSHFQKVDFSNLAREMNQLSAFWGQ